jgi:raffinose/stachyose/melibiose transport system substrate-binding protein
MKKHMKWLPVLLVLSMILVVSGAPVAAQDEKVSITLWTLSSRTQGVEDILDDFRAEYPNIDIEVSFADATAHQDGLRVAAVADTLPTFWFNWGGTLGGYYAENGLSLDLTEYAEANNWDEKFDSAGLEIMTLHGQLSAYPTALSMVGVFYRTDIFEEYGIEVPTTFEEFEAVLATLKENGECPISTAGSGGGWYLMRTIEQLLEHYAGPELHDAMNNLEESWNNEAFTQTLAKYQEWAEAGYFNEGFVAAPADDAPARVYSGECVMTFEGNWFERNVLGAELDNSLFGFFPFPNGGTNRMSAFGEGYQFNAKVSDAELDAAMKFMDFYYGLETIEAHPTNYKYPCPIKGTGLPEEYVNTALMVEAVSANGSFTIGDQALPKEVATALFSVQDMVGLGTSPEDGAAAMQDAIDQYLLYEE